MFTIILKTFFLYIYIKKVLSISDEINIENKSSELHKAKDLHEMSDSSFGASEEAISNVERRRKKKNSSFYGLSLLPYFYIRTQFFFKK
jgi:hypothetical protein